MSDVNDAPLNGLKRVSKTFSKPSLAKQAHKDECDINRIMRRWLRDGVATHLSGKSPVFKDVSETLDYREVCDRVLEVQDSFDSLPSEVRKRFGNDPLQVLDFVSDPSNLDQCYELGLIERDDPVSTVMPVSQAADSDQAV